MGKIQRPTKNSIRAAILKNCSAKSGKGLLEAVKWESLSPGVASALKYLLHGQNRLRAAYKRHLLARSRKSQTKLTFALDGRLVGDIGELIAADRFNLALLGTKAKNVDAVTIVRPHMKVQIKATFGRESLSVKHGGDHFLGLQLCRKGRYRVLYNGPAEKVLYYLKAPKAKGHRGRKFAGKRLEQISLGTWVVLNAGVDDMERIPLKSGN